jgi:phospholipid/cholesterol/gamma-HCH transport system permease protein
LSESDGSGPRAWYRTEQRDSVLRLVAGGDWVVHEAASLDPSLRALKLDGSREVEFDGSAITRMDSTGAWLVLRTQRQIAQKGGRLRNLNIPSSYQPLLQTLERGPEAQSSPRKQHQPVTGFLSRTGRTTLASLDEIYQLFGFLGRVTVESSEVAVRRDRELPWAAFVNQIEATGISALPIVGLLSFLLGVVLAYQGAEQLKRFSAELFTVNLVGIGVLREIGVLITAIMVAGRSGSAFTAQIGTMRLNQEIDAMETMGLNPVAILVVPRILGLLVAMPLVTFFANITGIIGGAVMCYFDLGITFPAFVNQLHEALTMNEWSFWLGLIKAPVFALIIALVGCFEGLRVEGTAESIGRLTTRSVVEAVFLVIAADAGFSILFSLLEI